MGPMDRAYVRLGTIAELFPNWQSVDFVPVGVESMRELMGDKLYMETWIIANNTAGSDMYCRMMTQHPEDTYYKYRLPSHNPQDWLLAKRCFYIGAQFVPFSRPY